ncbi:PREDICTED: probable serine/threonine-protein kinase dyrk2 [Camelina sativa]|uniref:Probable serine/threonine-protein kinase dyrk2 n=1 Tax=Camelina sativa TaxID=90675 RepID=A0ABM1Q6V0_CAMSA|nr:PREDICTED: probable serine/threonine-protein kinase dyrk2 [Camelina sativa]
MDVCIKIIKNNKDFFDQSLDEIKLLKYVNKHDPADKYHLLRLYDYFYYREHLLIVCELLKANLYEFHKFNRESGGEVYFTMPRLQSITIQCLESLQFLHGLGLIHCDLKPENILVKSYSRCEIKVIDLGSSCFETDHLCSYVQSRSYRAPEVILGLPYDKKIDVWSLGCILAELCTGNVLFQNDSPIKSFMWKVVSGGIPVADKMVARGLKVDTRCQRCGNEGESSNHVLFSCTVARQIWALFNFPCPENGFDSQSLYQNMYYLLLVSKNPKVQVETRKAFPWILWQIWKNRNLFCIEGKSFSLPVTISKIRENVQEWIHAQALNEVTAEKMCKNGFMLKL